MKLIKRVAVSKIPKINGSVVDSFNVEDKTTNAPSIRAVEEKLSYSAEEKVVGEWFGKPLYRKTYNTYERSGNIYYLDRTDFIKNIDIKFIDGSIKFKFNTLEAYYKLPLIFNDDTFGKTNWVHNTYDSPNLSLTRIGSDEYYSVIGIESTIYYTKTTD